jgi:predicted negative regulator of RcsB-dependent stress response
MPIEARQIIFHHRRCVAFGVYGDEECPRAIRVFAELQTKYSGSAEGEIAQYYLGSIKADQGKLAEAEKLFQEVAQKGDEKYASLAKLSLAQILFADGRAGVGA